MSRKLTLKERSDIARALDAKLRALPASQAQAGKEVTRLLPLADERARGAEALGRHRRKVDQGFINKVLKRRVSTLNAGMVAVCKYVEIFDITNDSKRIPEPSGKLQAALARCWDGSARQEALLLRVLQALATPDDEFEKQ